MRANPKRRTSRSRPVGATKLLSNAIQHELASDPPLTESEAMELSL